MNAPSEDIKDILVADTSLGLTFGTDLFIGKEPDTPNNCVTIFDTGEYPPQLTMAKGEDYFYPTIQIRVRNVGYLSGWTVINNIRTVLHGLSHEIWNSTTYEVISCASGPEFLDWDDKSRARFIINFNLQRQ